MSKTFEELKKNAEDIRTNQLPESNTATLVGGQLVDMVEMQEAERNERIKAMTEANISVLCPTSGYKADGSLGGDLYDLALAIPTYQAYLNAQVGSSQIENGKMLIFKDKDDNGNVVIYGCTGSGWFKTVVDSIGDSKYSTMSQKAVKRALGVKTVIFPQTGRVNIDLVNKKVIITAGDLYVTYFNSNQHVHVVSEQNIDIADKLNGDSILLYDIEDRTFVFYNYKEQTANIKDKHAIVACLWGSTIYYQSCDFQVNGVSTFLYNQKNQLDYRSLVSSNIEMIESNVTNVALASKLSAGHYPCNQLKGSDLFNGFTEGYYNTTFPSTVVGGTSVERVLSDTIGQYIYRFTLEEGTVITSDYAAIQLKRLVLSIPQNEPFWVSIKVRKLGDAKYIEPNFIANGTWLQKEVEGVWKPMQMGDFMSESTRDGNWYVIKYKCRLVSSDISEVALRLYLCANKTTYNSRQIIELTEPVISLVNYPDYAHPYHEDDFGKTKIENLEKDVLIHNDEIRKLQEVNTPPPLFVNELRGSDFVNGFVVSNYPALTSVPSFGGTSDIVIDSLDSRRFIKNKIPAGTEFTNTYRCSDICLTSSRYYENDTQIFYLKFKYRVSSNLLNILPIVNNTWAQYLNEEGQWVGIHMYSNVFNIIKDGEWHEASAVVRHTDQTKSFKVSVRTFYTGGVIPITYTEDLDFDFSSFVVSITPFNSNKTVYHVDDFNTDLSGIEKDIADIQEELEDIKVGAIVTNHTKGCVFMSLGDSITTESSSYYVQKLRQLLQPSKYYSLAVAGSHWADKNGTIYDGNPLFNGSDNNVNNVIGNQVQKIINNPSTYNIAPDIIIIAAGTNDGNPVLIGDTDTTIIEEVNSHFMDSSGVSIPITSQTDANDTYLAHRKTIGGAMRYVVCTLQKLYPKARIYILTPIQGCNSIRNYKSIEVKQRYISEAARHLGVPVIHVGEECGIHSDFEYLGAMWSDVYDPNSLKEGRDLKDGLHPNNNGGWKMANYIYREIIKDYIPSIYV